jgi:hypothetical protein
MEGGGGQSKAQGYLRHQYPLITSVFLSSCRWNIVIHGGIDGYSRLITFLGASTNNRARTVLDLFLDGIFKHGVPSRVRCDRGGENVEVCTFMEAYRGPGRGSALQGRSVHNQRIERFWVDLWRQCTHVFYSLFRFLEQARVLYIDNPSHMWCLHYVFMPRLNHSMQLFTGQWNAHGLSSVAGNLSPQKLFLQRMLALKGSDHTAVCDFFPPGDHGDRQVTDAAASQPLPAADSDTHDDTALLEAVTADTDGVSNHITIPETPCPFSEAVLTQLKGQVNPLEQAHEPAHGCTLYEKTIAFLEI